MAYLLYLGFENDCYGQYDLLYADDTLLVGNDAKLVRRYMQLIATEARKYGLILNNSKLEMMQINSNASVYDMDGHCIKDKQSLKYLGVTLHKIGRADSEISSKIGIAKADFRGLVQIWKHANISKKRKIALYISLILSKLRYGLQTVWLTKVLQKRVNAFHWVLTTNPWDTTFLYIKGDQC